MAIFSCKGGLGNVFSWKVTWYLNTTNEEEQNIGDNQGFPGGSKESACSAGDLGWIPGWEDLLEEGMATHSSILTWRIPMDRGAWWATVCLVTKSQTQLSDHAQEKKINDLIYLLSE